MTRVKAPTDPAPVSDSNTVATRNRMAEMEKSVALQQRASRNSSLRSMSIYAVLIANCIGIASLVGMLKPEHLSDRAYTLCVTMIDVEVVLIFLLAFFLEYSDGQLTRPLYEEASSIWENLATRDSLTGLANRLAFMHALDEEILITRKNRKQCAVLFIDLNKFKAINDTHGHAAGDAVIVHTAERIYKAVSSRDLAARLGGDEFAVLLRDVTMAEAHRMAEEIERSVSEPMSFNDKHLLVTASIGIRMSDEKSGRAEEILHDADLKMYKTKAAARWQRRGISRSIAPPVITPRDHKK